MIGEITMLDHASLTSVGQREYNEDKIGITDLGEDRFCFALADGLGGPGRGGEAAAVAVQSSGEVFSAFSDKNDVLEMIFEAAQKRVLYEQKARRVRNTMKTTLSVVTLLGGKLRYGTIGDTRIYIFRDSRLEMMSHDHSVAQALADAGKKKSENIRNHPDRSKLLTCIGEVWDDKPGYEISESIYMCKGMSVLMCTDGFWGNIHEDMMAQCLWDTDTAAKWLDAMAQIVKQNASAGDADNYSAIAIRY